MSFKKQLQQILQFRIDRNWQQFHNPKDMALSLVLEATEFLELFQWKRTPEEIEDVIASNKDELRDELADVLYWVLLLANDLDIDLEQALDEKMKQNTKKYPVEKSKGISSKYTELNK